MKYLVMLSLVGIVGCQAGNQVEPPKAEPATIAAGQFPEGTKILTTHVEQCFLGLSLKPYIAFILSLGIVGCQQAQPLKNNLGYTPIKHDIPAYEYVSTHHCDHRHHEATKDWDNISQKIVDAPPFDAYDCDGIGGVIIITEEVK